MTEKEYLEIKNFIETNKFVANIYADYPQDDHVIPSMDILEYLKTFVKPKPEFKVGDRVCVYFGRTIPFKGTITGIDEYEMIYVTEDGFYSAHNDSPFNAEQCRKLRKKK